MYCKCILLFVLFCIQNGDAVSQMEMVVNFFENHNSQGFMPLNTFKKFVQDNYDLTNDCQNMVRSIEVNYKNGINKEVFLWANSIVDKDVKCPEGFAPGSKQLVELIEKSKAMDKDFDGDFFDRNRG